MRNFVRGLQRFEVRRAPLTVNRLLVTTQGKSVRTRVCACTQVTRMEIQTSPRAQLTLDDAFGCWTRTAGPLMLPPGDSNLLGIEFYIAAKPAENVTIQGKGGTTDKIQMRSSNGEPKLGESFVSEGDSLTRSDPLSINFKSSVILVCRRVPTPTGAPERFVWVTESLSDTDAGPDWKVV